MTTDRFHKAAKDGLLEVLREATRKECNNKDESGMTPTLWAAFEGHIEALRLLCGRGGEPDKADYFGNTALHLAAARGHKECVTFLVNFGANVYAMDVDGHTAQELAAINNRDDILRFLDAATAKLENNDKKKAKSLKEKAKKDHDKSQKQYQKRQSKAEVLAEKELKKLTKEWEGYNEDMSTMPHRPSTVLMALKQKMTRSTSQGNLLAEEQPRPTYSALVGTVNSGARGRGAVYKKALASKMRNGTVGRNGPTDDFKVGEVETTGRRSVTSLSGLRRDSEVMYVGTFGAGPQQRGNVADVFTEADTRKQTLTRSASQPDFTAPSGEDSGIGQEVLLQEPASIFDRPGFGSVAFRRSITATLGALPTGAAGAGEDLSIGSAGSLARHAYQPAEWNTQHSESSTVTSDEEGEAEESGYASLERFLTAWGLSQYVQKFKDEQIDLDALMLLTESDMKSLGLPLGPYRKLVTAVQERKQALSHPGAMVDTAI
ncbi:Usher syndrome type-1G protein homolog [Pectinophora gossypiella]|uniref:Usher syndrome type-1G protein homolog n=1 Tax=Pectinophora gossypiella TaxID=13191 RepID=UPI00214EB3B3|nr:Usher syndrome type-1G protein homolog [Pectinophora gossypiella]